MEFAKFRKIGGRWRIAKKHVFERVRHQKQRETRMASQRWQLEDTFDSGETSSDANYTKYHRRDLHCVLVNPQIPQNVGTIARSCAASRVGLHIVQPMAFELDDTKLKRAGLDYWKSVFVKLHDNWEGFLSYYDGFDASSMFEVSQDNNSEEKKIPRKRMLAYSKRGTTLYTQPETVYYDEDVTFLMFGSETTGLTDDMLQDIQNRCGEKSLVRIPICEDHVRSLNLSVCVGISVWDAIRQLDYDRDHDGVRSSRHRDMYNRERIINATNGGK